MHAFGKHGVVHRHINIHLAVICLVGVTRVEEVARINLAPDNLAPLPLARQQPDAGAVFGVPDVGKWLPSQ